MNRLSLAFVFLCTRLVAAEDPGFVPLFNGSNLDGWVNANCAPETWSVRDGVIHCTGRPTGAMRTARQYENFVLELEWRHLSKGGNSGVFIWGTPIAAPGVPFLRGIEVQVLDEGFNIPGKNEWYTTHGDVFPIHGATMKPFGRHNDMRSFPSEERSKPSPEWNHYRIVCTNGVIRLSVNGKEVSGGEDCNYRKGYLALESEGAPVEFRNIRLQELPSSQPAAELIAPLDEGWRALLTGLDWRGWRTNSATVARWKLQGEGVATKTGPGEEAPAILWTEPEFKDAEWVIDCRVPKEWNKSEPPSVRIGTGTGDDLKVPLAGVAPGRYVRHVITRHGGKVTVKADGRELSTLTGGTNASAKLGLDAGTTGAEFMNIYVRDL